MRAPFVLLVLASACSVTNALDGSDTQASSGTTYVSIMDFSGIDQGAWYDLGNKLAGELATAYPGVSALTFNCSVTSKAGDVHDCAWTLAASRAQVDVTTAAISVDAVNYECHVHPKTTGPKLLAQLSRVTDALHEPLPGMGTLADALPDCFAHPIGGTPLPTPTEGIVTYVDAAAYYTSGANQAKWTATLAAFKLGFDDICGDTFCGSDYGDLQSLQLVCAVTKSTGNVKGCSWVFAGSYSGAAPNGAVSVTQKTFRCDFTIHGTISQLISTLTATGTDNPIQRALPGETSSAYDALGGCLP